MRLTAEGPRGFSARERRTLAAIAAAALPAGRVFPAAGEEAVDKLERYLTSTGGTVVSGYRALLATLEASALLRYGRALARLDDEAIRAILDRFRRGDYLRRQLHKALIAPLKIAHFNDKRMYDSVGCVFGVANPARPEPRPAWMQARIADPADVDGETIECDAVVIGTGAGGAVVAKELAERGVAVVMLEEGEYHGRHEFTGQAADMQRMMFRDLGATFAFGNTTIPVPIGRTVGGTTTINSGTCYRAPARVLHDFGARYGLRELSPDALAPHYDRVEAILGVAEARPEVLGGVARLIARGCDALGWEHRPLRRNAPDCDGQGVCVFGCPTDAKRSTNVSYVPLALRAGAQLIKNIRAEEVLVENGRAVGVRARRGKHEVTVRAKAVVVSCGALMTPVFLLGQGLANGSGELGKNLTIHPATGVFALFDEKVEGYKGVPQGYAIEEFHEEGLLFEGAFAPLDVGAAGMPIIGPRLIEILESFDRVACFGFMIEDTSRGRVRRGPGNRPLITYVLNDHDVARMKRGIELLLRVYFAAGARSVFPNVHGFDEMFSPDEIAPFARARVSARDFDITAYHPLGTARMGRDPRRSVVGSDHQAHDLPGLYIVDGSAVPGSLAVNPQLTIMALADRAAGILADRLS